MGVNIIIDDEEYLKIPFPDSCGFGHEVGEGEERVARHLESPDLGQPDVVDHLVSVLGQEWATVGEEG